MELENKPGAQSSPKAGGDALLRAAVARAVKAALESGRAEEKRRSEAARAEEQGGGQGKAGVQKPGQLLTAGGALVGQAGKQIAVADDEASAPAKLLYPTWCGQMLLAVGCEEIGHCPGGKVDVAPQDGAEESPCGSVGWLCRGVAWHLWMEGSNLVLQQALLGGGARTINPLENDEILQYHDRPTIFFRN